MALWWVSPVEIFSRLAKLTRCICRTQLGALSPRHAGVCTHTIAAHSLPRAPLAGRRAGAFCYTLESSLTYGGHVLHLNNQQLSPRRMAAEHTAVTAFSKKVFSAITVALASIRTLVKPPKETKPFFPQAKHTQCGHSYSSVVQFLLHFMQSFNSTGSSISINSFLSHAGYFFWRGPAIRRHRVFVEHPSWAAFSALLLAGCLSI